MFEACELSQGMMRTFNFEYKPRAIRMVYARQQGKLSRSVREARWADAYKINAACKKARRFRLFCLMSEKQGVLCCLEPA